MLIQFQCNTVSCKQYCYYYGGLTSFGSKKELEIIKKMIENEFMQCNII